MPFKSKKQQRWAHTKEGLRKLGGPKKVAEQSAAEPFGAPAKKKRPGLKRSRHRPKPC